MCSSDLDAGGANGIRHARDQGRLRPDDDEIDPGLDSQGHHGVGVGDPTRQGDTAREVGDAGVARGCDDLVDRRVEAEGADDGVFAGPGPDDENLHAPNLEVGPLAGPARSARLDW